MIQAIHVLVLVHGPLLWHVVHAELLALVHERGAGLEAEEESEHLGALGAVGRVVVTEPRHRPWLVVVLQVERVPAAVVTHELLPLGDGALELRERPLAGGELAARAVVDVHAV